MILILASRVDDRARALASAFPRGRARVLTCRDLSRPGWLLGTDAREQHRIVAAAHRLRPASVSGIVSLIPCVRPQELVHIVPADREYVAAEMTAMLAYWLSTLTCPILNRATAGSLCGPGWRPERWCHLARAHGIPVQTLRRATKPDSGPPPEVRMLTIVGPRVIGSGLRQFAERARAVAATADVELLQLWFSVDRSGPKCLGAPPVPDIASPIVQSAIVDYLSGRAA
jgi:hypothetical protein